MEFTDKIKNEVSEKIYAESMGEISGNKYESAIIVLKAIKPYINIKELTKLYFGFKTFSDWIQAICEEENKKDSIDNGDIVEADFELSALDKELLTVEFMKKILMRKY